MNKKLLAATALLLTLGGCAAMHALKLNGDEVVKNDPGLVGRVLTDVATFNWAVVKTPIATRRSPIRARFPSSRSGPDLFKLWPL